MRKYGLQILIFAVAGLQILPNKSVASPIASVRPSRQSVTSSIERIRFSCHFVDYMVFYTLTNEKESAFFKQTPYCSSFLSAV